MNCVLFAKMDQVFSLRNRTLKKILEKWQKVLEKSGNFVSPEKWEPCKQITLTAVFKRSFTIKKYLYFLTVVSGIQCNSMLGVYPFFTACLPKYNRFCVLLLSLLWERFVVNRELMLSLLANMLVRVEKHLNRQMYLYHIVPKMYPKYHIVI